MPLGSAALLAKKLRPTADGEEEIVGKLNVVSFDEEPRRVHIISVNNARLPSVSELEARLNSIYRQAVCTWTVIAQDPVTLTFPGGKMTHGGSGTASTYNSDQRAIAKAFESSGRQMEPGSLYLFFVEDVTFKDRSLAGYMPLQRQVGFIYGNPTLEVVAHELAHGAFMMRHTFSPKAFIIGEGQTQNLMDYAGGVELWKHQWDLIHNPEKILFSWAQDEEEGAMRVEDKCWSKRHGGWMKNYPDVYLNKKKLRYVEVCSYMYASDLWRTYYKLADGNILMVDQVRKDSNSSDIEPNIHYLFLAEKNEFILIDINTFEDDCLSCDLDLLAKNISATTGKFVGRYILPLEDMYILVSGEDFDGEEASRIAAGGFIVLEVVQVGKIFKLAKGARIFRAGKAVSPGTRVVQQFAKSATEQTVANIAAQLTMHFILETVNAQSESDVGIDDVFLRAVGKVNVKEAVISSMINFASLDNKTRNAFECALQMVQGIDEHTNDFSFGLYAGTRDCLINLGITLIGQRLVGTSAYNQLRSELAETAKYDFVRQRLSTIISQEALETFTQTFVTSGIDVILRD